MTELNKKPTICLNMIVKNESKIITRLFDSVVSIIDCYCICDTGSTDNTIEIIEKYFLDKNIPGKIVIKPFVNFAYNRSFSLTEAKGMSDYVLLLDADMILKINNFKKDILGSYDSYSIIQGNNNLKYPNKRIVRNNGLFKYVGVTHEYIDCVINHNTCSIDEIDLHIYDIGDGGAKSDKYERDIRLLTKGIEEEPENIERYTFYLANSYKDYNNPEKAIEYYKKVLTLNNWIQEKYMSCLNIYRQYEKLNKKKEGIYYLIESYKYDKQRVECIYNLIVYYCVNELPEMAMSFYNLIRESFENNYINFNSKLFIEPMIYDFYLPYYMIIIADRIKDRETGIKMYEMIFKIKPSFFNSWWIKNLLHNLQFTLPYVKNPDFFINARSYIDFLQKNDVELKSFDFLYKYKDYNIINDSICNIRLHKFTKMECEESKNILFYVGFSNENWNYSFLKNNALGGSEKAVAYLTKLFPKNYNIYISGGVENEEFDNIKYIHLSKLEELTHNIPFHTIIISRYIGFFEMYQNISFYRSFIWVHDTNLIHYGCDLSCDQILTKWNDSINGVICLTDWHSKLIENTYPILKGKINIINNGIQCDLFSKINNKVKNRFIYTSRPERGLEKLITLWPKILEMLPDAKLVISSYVNFNENNYIKIMNSIRQYSSIIFMGNLNTTQLYEEMSIAEYWLYPCNFCETSCITALEMLMSETICLYYPLAGLNDTIKDNGFQINHENELDVLYKLINMTDKDKELIRIRGKKYAESCSWKNRYIEWEKLLFTNFNK